MPVLLQSHEVRSAFENRIWSLQLFDWTLDTRTCGYGTWDDVLAVIIHDKIRRNEDDLMGDEPHTSTAILICSCFGILFRTLSAL